MSWRDRLPPEDRPPPVPDKAGQDYLDSIETEETITREEETDRVLLTKYGIPQDMWDNWATAAGYPGARYDDPSAVSKVALYAANTLYEEFGNWSLVAIGWRYGAKTARQFQEVFGNNIASEIVEQVMGSAGGKIVDQVVRSMYAQGPPPDPMMQFARPAPTGNVQVNFVNEQEEVAPGRVRKSNPVHNALVGVLRTMQHPIQQRMEIEGVDPQTVPPAGTDSGMPQPLEDDDGKP